MKFSRSDSLPEILIIQPQILNDHRGFFFEAFQTKRYREIGIQETFVQDNVSRSVKNTLRGLHYQLKSPQGKLVGVTSGVVYDVVVDIRQNSPTFGKWAGFELNAIDFMQLYIPAGFAHGFCVLSESADFYYKCTDYYVATDEFGILWNDAGLGISWPLLQPPILSCKDQNYLTLDHIDKQHLPRYQKK